MTTTMKSTVGAKIGWAWRDRSGDLPIVDANRLEASIDLDGGVASGEANVIWRREGQALASGESATYLLDQLSRTIFGYDVTISLASVKAILIVHRGASSDGTLLVGGATTDEWLAPFGAASDTVRVMQGSPLLLACVGDGWSVSSNANALRVAAQDGPVVFDIAILGATEESSSSSSSA